MTNHIVTHKGENIKYVIVELVPKSDVSGMPPYRIGLLAGMASTKIKGEEIDLNVVIQTLDGKLFVCNLEQYGISLIKSFDGKTTDLIMFHKHEKDQIMAINFMTQLLHTLAKATRANLETGAVLVETYKDVPKDLLAIGPETASTPLVTTEVINKPVYEKYTVLKRTTALPTKTNLSTMKELVDMVNAGTYTIPAYTAIADDLADEKKEAGLTSTGTKYYEESDFERGYYYN